MAFQLGKKTQTEGISAFKIIGCHTDSPVFKMAPKSKAGERAGFNQINVFLYGGGLWHTWFDRDLSLGGKIIVNDNGRLVSKYWRSKQALVKVPNLAIHLTETRGSFEPNKEQHTRPILASGVVDQLFGEEVKSLGEGEDKFGVEEKHYKTFLNLIAGDLGIER